MMNYKNGGLANIAQNLAKQGRHGDTQLVHMSPKEVNGLQALAKANGTSLTINPTTGLPEAFRIESLIPMVAGAALTATGVGAPLAALMVGGAYGAATGSIEKGLMAGIGAYGGAGITTGLAEAGASAAVENAGANVVQQTATQAGTTGAAAPVGDVFAGYSPTGSAAGTAGTTVGTGTGATSAGASNQALVGESYAVPRNPALGYAGTETGVVNPSVLPQAATPTSPVTPTLSNVGRGIESLGTSAGRTAAYNAMPTGTLPATGISLLTASQPGPSSVPGYQSDEYDRRLKGYRLSPNYQAYQAPTPNPYYRPTYAADGGVMSSFDDEPGEDMAHGGVASLGGYSDGGRMLRGPGDGMSDSIPGVIGGKQPARLADGEFVVPADVVSHLGNGSTEAGAKKLYGMMDKIRQARTGKKKQAPEIKADRYLPMKKMASGGITSYAEGGATPSFSDAQVASYIATNNLTTPAQVAQMQATFGVSNQQVANAQNLLSSGSPSVNQATAAYNQAIAANPSQAAANAQALADRQAALGIQTTYTPPTNPTATPSYAIPSFSDAQVASYLRTNNITTPAQIAQVQSIFNITPAQVARAQSLLASNDPSVDQTTAAYNQAIAANPQLAADNARVLAERMAALGIKQIIPPIPPALIPPTTPTTPASSAVYKQGFVPRVSGINVSDAMKDPFSNAGLEALYSQMMGQYQKPTPPMSDAQVKSMVQRLVNEKVGGAEIGQQLINAGVPVNQTVATTGLSPDIVNQSYLGGQYLGTTPPPTLNTLYNYSAPALSYRPAPPNNLVLAKAIADAANPAPEPATGGFLGGAAVAPAGNPNGA